MTDPNGLLPNPNPDSDSRVGRAPSPMMSNTRPRRPATAPTDEQSPAKFPLLPARVQHDRMMVGQLSSPLPNIPSGSGIKPQPWSLETGLIEENIIESTAADPTLRNGGDPLPQNPSPGNEQEEEEGLEWHEFMKAYAMGQWDPIRIPTLPKSTTSSSATLAAQDLKRGATAPAGITSPSTTNPIEPWVIPTPSSNNVTSPFSPPTASRGSASSSSHPPPPVNLAQRRGITAPDLSSSTISITPLSPTNAASATAPPTLISLPVVPVPPRHNRAQSRSASDLQNPARLSPSSLKPGSSAQLVVAGHPNSSSSSSSSENNAMAATMRWAAVGIDVAPLSLPSPGKELTDPLRIDSSPHVTTSGGGGGGSWKSREGAVWGRKGLATPGNKPVLASIAASPSSGSSTSSPSGTKSNMVTWSIVGRAIASPRDGPTSVPVQKAQSAPGHQDYFGEIIPSASITVPPVPKASLSPGSGPAPSPSKPAAATSPGGGHNRSQTEGAIPLKTPPSAAVNTSQPTPSVELKRSLSSTDPEDLANFLSVCSVTEPSDETQCTPSIVVGSTGPTLRPPLPSHTVPPLNKKIREEEGYSTHGYLEPPFPPDEAERRKALYQYNVLHSAKDLNFDRVAHLAKLVFGTKMVIISLIDGSDQWFKAESGFGTFGYGVERNLSFCAHTILQRGDEPMIVLNALNDWRFAGNPFVLGPPNIRFYAGAPLRTQDGYNIGSLCVLDDQPRTEFTPRQRHTLKEFAAIVMREMELWRDKIRLRIRDRIQTSMEHFTRECLEMDEPDAATLATSGNMDKVYDNAVKLVKRTLDVDGALIMDVSHFEAHSSTDTDGTPSVLFHGDLFEGANAADVASNLPDAGVTSVNNHTFGRIPPLPILAAETNQPLEPRKTYLSGEDHAKLSAFLGSGPDGKIYERVVPSCFRHVFPGNIRYAMVVPIFTVDGRPFALLCAYTSDKSKHFLEGYELQYLRAIGVIILSAVLKRRMMLADKAKSLFISNISHELRTPLHGILAAAELLSETALSPTQTSFLQTVQGCGTSLVETVNHVLDFTKLTGNSRGTGLERAIRPSWVNLRQLLEETVEGCWIGARARAIQGASEIGSVYSPDRGPPSQDSPVRRSRYVETIIDIGYRQRGWVVTAEKGGIRRVLMNLIGNSLKFTTDGYVHVTLHELPHEDGAHRIPIEIAVNDTGKGISKDFLQNQLFHPFSQENPLQTGVGLGLSIVDSIVRSETIAGKVDVWSNEGVGTEIRVTFEVDVLPDDQFDFVIQTLEAATVSLIGFDPEVRGYKLLHDVVGTYLTVWCGLQISDNRSFGDILVLNETLDVLLDMIKARDTSRAVVVLSSARGDSTLMKSLRDMSDLGGICRIIFKPFGPSRIYGEMKHCMDALDAKRLGLSPPSTESIDQYRSELRRHPRAAFDEHPPHTPSSTATEHHHRDPLLSPSDRSPVSRIISPHTPPGTGMMRRKSEEITPHIPHRPSMAPRGSTFHSSQTRANSVSISEVSVTHEAPSPDTKTVMIADSGSVMLKSATGSLSGHTPLRVLLVEDNLINRTLLGQWLKKRNMPYEEAVDGLQGVQAFEQRDPNFFDVVLIDLSMPVMDGFQATAEIRKLEVARRRDTFLQGAQANANSVVPQNDNRCKIFALTGLASVEDKRRAFTAGVDGYLVKPVSFATLTLLFKKLSGR